MQNIYKNSEQLNNKLKSDFINLLREIERPNANIEGLIQKLETSDFFSAPASTRYHGAYVGGLVEHSLNVYYNLLNLIDMKGLKEHIDKDSIIICSLLHDISKMNYYEITSRNEKVYCDNGTKSDSLGKFEWQASLSFKTRAAENRFIYGNHEETSEFMIKTYIPLSVEESVAILNHHAGMGHDCIPNFNISDKYNRYPLATLLHTADFLATYIDENE